MGTYSGCNEVEYKHDTGCKVHRIFFCFCPIRKVRKEYLCVYYSLRSRFQSPSSTWTMKIMSYSLKKISSLPFLHQELVLLPYLCSCCVALCLGIFFGPELTKNYFKTHIEPKLHVSLHGTPPISNLSFYLPSAPLNSPLGTLCNLQFRFPVMEIMLCGNYY